MAPTQLLMTDLYKSPFAVRSASDSMSMVYALYGYRPVSVGFTKIGFTGQLWEPQRGHYLLGNGYRAYNPILMRFHSPDRLSPFGQGGINVYAYCEGDPVNWRDPSGRNRKKLTRSIFSSTTNVGLRNKDNTGHLSSGERNYLERVYDLGKKRLEYDAYLTKLSTAIQDTEKLIISRRSPSGEPHSDESLKRLAELAQMTVRRAEYTEMVMRLDIEIDKAKRGLLHGSNTFPQIDDLDMDQAYDQAIRGVERRVGNEFPSAYAWRSGSI